MADREDASPVAPEEAPPASGRGRGFAGSWELTRTQSQALLLVLIALALGILAGGYTGYYEYTRPAVYTSSAALLIDQEPAVFASGDEGILGKLSRLRIKYVSLVPTTVFATPVAQQARLPVGTVRAALSASADLNSMLIVITATMHAQNEVRNVAQLSAQHLVSYLQDEQNADGIKAGDQVSLTMVSPAGGPARIAPSNKKAVLEGVVVFAVITAIGALAADLLRRRKV